MLNVVLRLVVISVALVVSSCNRDDVSKGNSPASPPPAAAPAAPSLPAAPQGPTDEEAISAIRATLASRGRHMGDINFDCSTYFSIGEITIRDRQISESTARIEARAIITSNTTLQDGAGAGDTCFGQPRGGWVAGEEITHDETFTFERWSSGWRLAAR